MVAGLKIIFDRRGENIESHAKDLVVAAAKKRGAPHGIATYSAQIPETCDDCGETYWHRNDEMGWFPHLGCKGKNKGLGF